LRAVFHDDARTKKPDTRHDIGGDLDGAGLPIEPHAKSHERGRADRHQHIGSQPGVPLTPLAFSTDECRQNESNENADAKVK
jgi:hypothetical protein